VTLQWSVTHSEEIPRTGGTTVTSATRATSARVATRNKKYSNLLANLATSMPQGLKARLHSRPAFTTLLRSTSERRSMMAVTCNILSKQGEGTVPTSTTMMKTMTASPPSPPTTPKNPIPRSLNQSESQVQWLAGPVLVDPMLLHCHRGFRGIQLHQSPLLLGTFGIHAPHLA
jgi:hypothetical protein